MECARCFLPSSHILVVTERVMPGLFPNLADLWQIISTSQSLGVPGAVDVFPGMILFTGQDPDPFWAEAIVSVGDPGDNAVWRASSSLALKHQSDGRSNLLAPSAVAESDTPQDSRALMASLHTPFAGCRPESSLEVACLASLLATAAIASCFEVREPSRSLSYVATGAGHAGHPEVVLQLLEVLAPLRVLSFPGWGTTVCDVATLEHTISFGNKGMPPLFVQALHTRDAPDLGAWYPLVVGLALCSSVTERVPFWYLRRRLQTGPRSSFRVPLGGGLPGLTLEHFPVPEGLKACEPILSPTWGLSPVVAGGSSQEPQPSVGSALQTIAAHASDLQDALLQVSMPAIAGLALRRPKATPATRR